MGGGWRTGVPLGEEIRWVHCGEILHDGEFTILEVVIVTGIPSDVIFCHICFFFLYTKKGVVFSIYTGSSFITSLF